MARSASPISRRRSFSAWRACALHAAAGLLPLAATLAVARPALSASLTQVGNFGANPANARMFVYVPDNKAPNPPILVVLHYCSGSASAMFTGTGFKGEADKYGFVVIYAETSASDGCWDVHSTQSLGHNTGGDSNSVVNMVKYAVTQYAANPQRVYATGTSSGAMMTNVLLGAYPEVFQGGAIFAGVPYGCFAGTSGWNSDCADGNIVKTGAAWGDLVRAANPGYSGYRPRVQIWHGTADDTLDYKNFGEEIKQWTNVLGVSETPSSTETNQPQSGYTRTRYKDANGIARVEAVSEAGQPHSLVVPADQVSKFFGLDATADPGMAGAGGSGAGGSGAGGSGAAGRGAGGMGMGGVSGGAASAGNAGGPSGASGLGGVTGVAGVGGRAGGAGGMGGRSAMPAGSAGGAGRGGFVGAAGAGTGGVLSSSGGRGGSGAGVSAGGFVGAFGGGTGKGGASSAAGNGGATLEPSVPDDPPVGGGGCGCRAGGSSDARISAAALALVALIVARRRRRT